MIFCLLLCSISFEIINAAPLCTSTNNYRTTKSSIACGEYGDCLTVTPVCAEPCGCDYIYFYNNRTNECLLNLEYLKQLMTEKYNTEEKLRIEAEEVFGGIIISAIFIAVCAVLCTLSACVYCARMHYSDHTLKKDVKALSEKLKRDGKLPKPAKKPTEPRAQSCNVVIEDAGVFVC